MYAIDLHPTIDVLLTCGRDGTARVWDMRTKACIHTLTGHNNTVADVKCQAAEPQVCITLNGCYGNFGTLLTAFFASYLCIFMVIDSIVSNKCK